MPNSGDATATGSGYRPWQQGRLERSRRFRARGGQHVTPNNSCRPACEVWRDVDLKRRLYDAFLHFGDDRPDKPVAAAGHGLDPAVVAGGLARNPAQRRNLLGEVTFLDGLAEGIVAKRLDDPYDPRIKRLKIKNPDYPRKEGASCSTGADKCSQFPPDAVLTPGPYYRHAWPIVSLRLRRSVNFRRRAFARRLLCVLRLNLTRRASASAANRRAAGSGASCSGG